MKKPFYVTTPIYYANSLPHMGHLYTTVVADALARYMRQRGHETYFLTGTDEHGTNIERSARRNSRTPKEQADYIVERLKKTFEAYGLDGANGGYDVFMRTTEDFHYEGVAEFWRRVSKSKTPKGRDCIYKGFYEGWFCAACAEFKTEDQYAKPSSEGGLPQCPVHDTPLDRVAEESYFFRLSDYDEALLHLYESQPEFVRPEARLNEVKSFVRAGLQDLSVSRLKSAVSWAIPVPDDPQHTVYIWFDALSNYITALGWGNDESKRKELFEKFWPGLHLIGKDILRQHAIYWPAFLLAAGVELPRGVVSHGTWVVDGRKMSKTLGNTIDPMTLHQYIGTDAVRYFLLREMSFGQDCTVGYESIIERANSDLASGLGNLVSRTVTMIRRYCDGVIPSGDIDEAGRLAAKRAGLDADAQSHATILELARNQFLTHLDEFAFHRALETAWGVIARTDKLISDTKPWELAKDESDRQTLNAVLYRSVETLRWLAVMLYPFMPDSSKSIWRQIGLEGDVSKIDPANLKWAELKAGGRAGETAQLFPRLDKRRIMSEIEKEKETEGSGSHATQAAVPGSETSAETKPEPPSKGATEADAVPGASGGKTEGVKSLIGIEDFTKVELRAAEVLTAERAPKSDKLLLLSVDLGEEKPRQILAGIAEHYDPESLVGRKIVVVANLQPRKLRGLESQGMLLAASVGEGDKPVLATFTEEVPNGARLK